MSDCLHIWIQPVAIVGQQRLSNGDIRQFIEGEAFSCLECTAQWRYENPEDLPQWLYERLQEEGRLPMPKLTPRIMDALERAVVSDQLRLFWPVET